MIIRIGFVIHSVMLCACDVLNFSSRPEREREFTTTEGNIPSKPNYSHTLTATPDPFVTDDPTSKALLTLRRDLFTNENGQILYYALLVALRDYCQMPENGTWDVESWPAIPNWKSQNTSYQVTPPWWNPFRNSCLSEVTYTLGDDSCDSDRYYCNAPLRENTKYSLKIRAFTQSGYQDTDIIRFETLAELPLTEIASLLGGCLFVTAAAVTLSIFNFGWIKRIRIFPGRKAEDASPVPEALSHKGFLRYAQELLNTPGRLGNEFHLLGTLSSDVSTLCLHAQRIDNRHKNRYGNILPFDMTRVKLSIIDDDPSTDYINASFIKGCKEEIQYIAGQGPKEETCHDFYRMIVEQNVELVVMLTELTENGVEKCFKYYPDKDEVFQFNEITVSSQGDSLLGDDIFAGLSSHAVVSAFLQIVGKEMELLDVCTRRVFVISASGRNLAVTHLHFKNWRDFECPQDTDIMLRFCGEMFLHRACLEKSQKNGLSSPTLMLFDHENLLPAADKFHSVLLQCLVVLELANKQPCRGCTLVHCSAGAGRTGAFIAIDILLQELKTNSKISVFNTVLKLRQQRINMVQTEAQLGYIYKCVSRAIERNLKSSFS